ncbi:MAG TPA: indolepyruvate oxidoreductase subunit beta [bacterium]
MSPTVDILIVGVGGQGILLAGELISEAALEAGYDVKKSEVHGMAQRGGAVSSHVRIGEKVFSPLIPLGQADVLLAFEKAEALRWVHFVKPSGRVIVNDMKWVPPNALLKDAVYPPDPIGSIRQRVPDVRVVRAHDMAKSLGLFRAANMVLVGAVSLNLDIHDSVWERIIKKKVPQGTEELNWRAFQQGRT